MSYRMDLLVAKNVERDQVLHLIVRILFRPALIGVVHVEVMSHRLDRLPARHAAHEAFVAVPLDDGFPHCCRYDAAS